MSGLRLEPLSLLPRRDGFNEPFFFEKLEEFFVWSMSVGGFVSNVAYFDVKRTSSWLAFRLVALCFFCDPKAFFMVGPKPLVVFIGSRFALRVSGSTDLFVYRGEILGGCYALVVLASM